MWFSVNHLYASDAACTQLPPELQLERLSLKAVTMASLETMSCSGACGHENQPGAEMCRGREARRVVQGGISGAAMLWCVCEV